jgi:hypothetical protein
MNLIPFLRVIIRITYSEYLFVLVLFSLLFIFRFFVILNNRRYNRKEEYLASIFLYVMEMKKKFSWKSVPVYLHDPHLMLAVLEDFDSKFSDYYWDHLKKEVLEKYLSVYSEKWKKSCFWSRRSFVARVYFLDSEKADPLVVGRFLQDKVPLIRMLAASLAAFIASPKLLHTLFKVMKKEPINGRYAYYDAILNGDSRVFSYMKENIKTEKDLEIRSLYIDLLSARFDSSLLDYIEDDLHSKNINLRLVAVRALLKFPTKETEKKIIGFLKDPSAKIRVEIVKILPSLCGKLAIKKLTDTLNDEDWWVRFNSALALKKLGKAGKAVLEKQKDELTQAAVKYALSLPDENKKVV